jgi:aryl-alcohol dehydrogenase-like predicted oxidoreductase
MRTGKLGADGPELSVIGFGAWEAGMAREWGEAPPEEQVIEAIEKVLETGINWIDTAEVCGNGTSETPVGRALAGRRPRVRPTRLRPAHRRRYGRDRVRPR